MSSLNFLTSIEAWEAFVLILGLVLIIIEMIHPGFGAPGITGSILLLFGVVFISNNFIQALILIIIILVILALALTIVLRSATNGTLSKHLVLTESQKKESGFVGTEDLDVYLNKEGIALTTLRPAGSADFDGVKIDVVTEGDFISKGSKVKIKKVEGRRIVVKQII